MSGSTLVAEFIIAYSVCPHPMALGAAQLSEMPVVSPGKEVVPQVMVNMYLPSGADVENARTRIRYVSPDQPSQVTLELNEVEAHTSASSLNARLYRLEQDPVYTSKNVSNSVYGLQVDAQTCFPGPVIVYQWSR
mmetsp:Transcript_22436/g.38738  ORF Transcript_22436/g.38738 Transcript_22436/m.38738 type:complete len:135 (-) Transcript_22436:155-559(-)